MKTAFEEIEQELHESEITNYVLITMLIITAVIAIIFYNQKVQYKKDIVMIGKDIAERQQRIDNVIEMLQYVNERNLELQEANEALIKHATPLSVNRAIKATPLPSMKG